MHTPSKRSRLAETVETPESLRFVCSSESAESPTGIWDDVRVFAYAFCGQVLVQSWLREFPYYLYPWPVDQIKQHIDGQISTSSDIKELTSASAAHQSHRGTRVRRKHARRLSRVVCDALIHRQAIRQSRKRFFFRSFFLLVVQVSLHYSRWIEVKVPSSKLRARELSSRLSPVRMFWTL